MAFMRGSTHNTPFIFPILSADFDSFVRNKWRIRDDGPWFGWRAIVCPFGPCPRLSIEPKHLDWPFHWGHHHAVGDFSGCRHPPFVCSLRFGTPIKTTMI